MIKCWHLCPLFGFDWCCAECEFKDECEERCQMLPSECGNSIMEEDHLGIIKRLADIVAAKKALEDEEAELKAKLKEEMEDRNIKKFETETVSITYVAETTVTSIDTTKLKKKYPDIAEECSKTSTKSAYLKVALK